MNFTPSRTPTPLELHEILELITKAQPKPDDVYLIVCNPALLKRIPSATAEHPTYPTQRMLGGVPLELDDWAPIDHIVLIPYKQRARYDELRRTHRPIKAAYLAANS